MRSRLASSLAPLKIDEIKDEPQPLRLGGSRANKMARRMRNRHILREANEKLNKDLEEEDRRSLQDTASAPEDARRRAAIGRAAEAWYFTEVDGQRPSGDIKKQRLRGLCRWRAKKLSYFKRFSLKRLTSVEDDSPMSPDERLEEICQDMLATFKLSNEVSISEEVSRRVKTAIAADPDARVRILTEAEETPRAVSFRLADEDAEGSDGGAL